MDDSIYFEKSKLQNNIELREEYIKWLTFFADWKLFITLTYRYDGVSVQKSKHDFIKLINVLNKDALGEHYKDKVGRCYFTYVLGTEMQSRDVIHFHFLVDDRINLNLLHDHWNKYCGFAWIDIIRSGDELKVVDYCTKYITKDGNLEIYKKRRKDVNLLIDRSINNWYSNYI
jgi:hypothetical protein